MTKIAFASKLESLEQARQEIDRVIRALNATDDSVVAQAAATTTGTGGAGIDITTLTLRDGSQPPTGPWDMNGVDVFNIDQLHVSNAIFLNNRRVLTTQDLCEMQGYALMVGVD